MARFGPVLLRVSLGIVFVWFGVLKFFPNLSPAQELATRTIAVLTGGESPKTADAQQQSKGDGLSANATNAPR